jgi:hypothetical protein
MRYAIAALSSNGSPIAVVGKFRTEARAELFAAKLNAAAEQAELGWLTDLELRVEDAIADAAEALADRASGAAA